MSVPAEERAHRVFRFRVGDDPGPVYRPAEEGGLRVGRAADNHLVVDVPYVSGCHAVFFAGEGGVEAEDRSLNGVFLCADGAEAERVAAGQRTSVPLHAVFRLGGPDGLRLEVAWEDCRAELFERAMVEMKQGRKEAALAAFDLLLHHYPSVASAYGYSGYLCSLLGQREKAIERYEAYLHRQGFEPSAALNTARLHEEAGSRERAAYWYRQVLARVPDDAVANARLRRLAAGALRAGPGGVPGRGSTEEILGDGSTVLTGYPHFSYEVHFPARDGRLIFPWINDIAKVMETDAYQGVGEKLGWFPEAEVRVHLYAGGDALMESGAVWPEGGDLHAAEGYCDLEDVHLVGPSGVGGLEAFRGLAVHEYVHLALHGLCAPGRSLPWWFHEGLANLLAGRFAAFDHEYYAGGLAGLAPAKRVLPERRPTGLDMAEVNVLLYLASGVVSRWVENRGWEDVRRWVAQRAGGGKRLGAGARGAGEERHRRPLAGREIVAGAGGRRGGAGAGVAAEERFKRTLVEAFFQAPLRRPPEGATERLR